jgi:hypothetical protein
MIFSAFSNFSYAQTLGQPNLSSLACSMSPRNFRELVLNLFIGCFINPAIPVIMAITFLFFIWGVFNFIRAEGDDKKKAKDFIVWGIVGLFVMVSVWGLVNILQYSFRLNNSQVIIRPVNTNFYP